MINLPRIADRTFMPLLAAALILTAAGSVQAQDWPQRPVRIIGPCAAGGNADVLARLTSFGADPLGNSPEQFATLIAADLKTWAKPSRSPA